MKKVLLLCLCLLLCGCAKEEPKILDEYDKQIEAMTLREKVGQLFIIRPDSLNFNISPQEISNPYVEGLSEVSDDFLANYAEYPVGGFIMFSKNIIDPDQIIRLNETIKANSKIKPLIAIDEEGGLIARLANNENFDLPKFPNVGLLKENQIDPYVMGQTIGQYLKTYGFNINFAPVADVNTNPDNPVIGERAFSNDPQEVADSARAFAKGLKENGIIPTFKHFPGHGDTAEDSHNGLAVSYKTKEEIMKCELIPFTQATDAIMVGHITFPVITNSPTPATFSSTMVNDLLRKEMGFEGVIITDSLDMGAVTNLYNPAEAAINAINAGCDILLMPHDLRTAFNGLVHAVEEGTIPIERIDASVKRILKLKDSIQ